MLERLRSLGYVKLPEELSSVLFSAFSTHFGA